MDSFKSLIWRLYYAGRCMERKRVTFRVGMRMAREAQTIYPDWNKFHPGMLAESRLKMYK